MSDDYMALQQLIMAYAVAVDGRRIGLLQDIFAPDARVEIRMFGVWDRAGWIAHCKEELPKLDATSHFCAPPVVQVSGDIARSRCLFVSQQVLNELRPNPFLTIGGYYDDEFARVDGRWWITGRTGTSCWWQGNPRVLGRDVPVGAIDWGEGHQTPAWVGDSLFWS